MKNLILIVCVAVLQQGCTLPQTAYHAVAVSKRRAQAIPPEQIDSHIVVSTSSSHVNGIGSVEFVVVIARDPDEAMPGRSLTGSTYQPSPVRQAVESVLQRALLDRGFRAANRMALQPILEEAAIKPQVTSTIPLFRVVGATHLLVLTRVRQIAAPEKYEWYEGFVGETKSWMVGTRVDYHLTLELMDAVTSEALWSASAQLNALLVGTPSETELLDKLIRKLADKLPSAAPGPAVSAR